MNMKNMKMKKMNQHICHGNEAYVCLADANLHLFPTVGKIYNDQLLNEICLLDITSIWLNFSQIFLGF